MYDQAARKLRYKFPQPPQIKLNMTIHIIIVCLAL